MFPITDPLPQIGVFLASDGYRLHYRRWVPPAPVRGRIVAVHGIQSHSGWYGWSCAQLARHGWDVWFADRRGSGMNEERRGHAPPARRLIDDVAELLHHVSAESPAVPTVLLSMSWGGKLALAVAAEQAARLAGLALLYPGLRPRVRPSWLQDVLLSWCRGRGYVNGLMPVPLDDPALFTSDPAYQERLRHDPLALHQVTRGFIMASRDLDALIESAPPAITCPIVVLLAGRDRIIDNAAVRQYATRFRGSLTVQEYADAAHTLEFEGCRDQMLVDLAGWLNTLGGTP
jgi:alpha-beta hydrolase superfamily lysophospholipase